MVGGGPAGLRAAEVLSEWAGSAWRVELFEGKPSVGRKFLVAGRGGLNLTHSEERARFATRYGEDAARWDDLLAEFGPEDLRAWAVGLGVGTFVGTSGRVFPVGKQAAGLLRRWVARLRERGVGFHVRHRWEDVGPAEQGGGWRLGFRTDEGQVEVSAAAVVFALGGASWPDTGSDGRWTGTFVDRLRVPVAPWQPANCGWEVGWRPEFLAVAEGQPLKNLALRAGATGAPVRGEALVTCYGLEGGAVYTLGPTLRASGQTPELRLDLKPDMETGALAARLPSGADPVGLDLVSARWRLTPAMRALLEFHGPGRQASRAEWLATVKDFALPLRGPRPIAEAISSAGGVRWDAVDLSTLGLRDQAGLFLAGEMLDWEAPTGGYLLQGCFATGTRAGRGAAEFLQRLKDEG